MSWISDNAFISRYNSIWDTAQGPFDTYTEFCKQVIIYLKGLAVHLLIEIWG